MTRPEKEIPWDKVELYLMSGASQKKIADSLGIHQDTLRDRVKEKYGVDYSTYSTSKSQTGELLLEAAQMQKALKGNTQMQIWLGKVKLGQREPETKSLDQPFNLSSLGKILSSSELSDEAKKEILIALSKVTNSSQGLNEPGI